MALFTSLLLAAIAGNDAVRKRAVQQSSSLLVPVDVREPDRTLFPPQRRFPLEPANTEVQGPKHTNKFWGNWVVDDANVGIAIYPSPYTLKFQHVGDSPAGGLIVMKGETDYQGSFFTTHWTPDFVFGAIEDFQGMHTVVKEQHFGVHVQVRPAAGSNCTVTYPIFAGMAYPTARYEGGCTPRVTSPYDLRLVEKVRAGVWRFQKNAFNKEYRVYLLTPDGEFVDDSYNFDAQGNLNKQLNGWVRFADLQQLSDTEVLDQHANTILVGWTLEVEEGVVRYNFETVGPSGKQLLHWAYANHVAFLDSGASIEAGLTRTRSPVKGNMIPFVGGNQWTFKVDLTEALNVDFLPPLEPKSEHVDEIRAALDADWEWFASNWRLALHKRDHYFSGKGFQKLATVCHMMAKFKGKAHADTTACAGVLKQAFQCMYKRDVADGSDRRLAGPDGEWSQEEGCWWSPFGSWYDESWGGIPSRWMDAPTCGLDFGNGCYNDHHYHWGYYVVSAAMLVELMPEMKDDAAFVDFINMFVRDVANPSEDDPYFPQFRAFDWFDMHSWSRGLKPDPNGKDQESTSEEVNFHYGLLLWGKVLGNDKMQKLGATILTVASRALQEYFLMKRDNPNHPQSFSKYHVTGIFFQNKVHLTTWFGMDTRYIHGIQMLPLTAGLFLSRKPDFCFEEWIDELAGLTIDHTDPWWSILLTGNLAMHSPEEAWPHLVQMERDNFDDGLTKSWALYWTSVQEAGGARPTPTPTPAPPIGGGPGGPGTGGPYCAPGQLCPGGLQCPASGDCSDAGSPSPVAPSPLPPPTPTGAPVVYCNPFTDPPQRCPSGDVCPQCGSNPCACP